MSIALSIGHGKTTSGAYDPGAVNGSFHEHKIAREIAKYAQEYYNATYEERCDLINYNADSFLTERIRKINAGAYDFAAEIHLNAGGGTGSEVYKSVTSGSFVADRVSAAIASEFSIRDRGAKIKTSSSGSDYFAIIRETKMQSLLIECLFIDKDSDLELVKTAEGQKKMGRVIAKAIAEARNIKVKSKAPIKSNVETDDSIYRVQAGAFKNKDNAENLVDKLKDEGFNAFVVKGK